MYTLKIIAMASLFAFSRYDGSGGCVANFAQDSADMTVDMGSGLQVTPARISVSSGATLQIDGGLALAGQSVQVRQGAAVVALGALDAQGHLQKVLGKADLAPLGLGAAQVVVASGAQAQVRFFIEPKMDNPPALYQISTTAKENPTPVWVGVAQKKILTLNFRNASIPPAMPIISQSIGEFSVDTSGLVVLAPMQNYKSYSSFVFEGNYDVLSANFGFSSTGIGLTKDNNYVAEYFSANKSTIIRRCPLDAGCDMTFVPRLYSRITALTSERSGALFAAIVTAGGSPATLKAFSEGTLGTAVDIVGASTALPHETMLGVGKLDEDDTPDLIALSVTGSVSIWLGSQGRLTASAALTGVVQQALTGAQVAAPSALGVGDLDGDGLDDIVVANSAQVVMLINQGGGHFSVLVGPAVPAGLAPVTAIAIGDVSVAGKGIPDLVLASKDQHSIGAIENGASY